MKNLLRWLLVYSFFGALSASLGYSMGADTQSIEGWWLPIVMLPFTTFITFIGFAIIYKGLTLIVIGSGIALFLGSSVAYAITKRQACLIGVAVGTVMMSWWSVSLFFITMSV